MREISVVLPISDIEGVLPEPFDAGLTIGDRYMTVIEASYLDIYNSAASLLIKGYVHRPIHDPSFNVPERATKPFGVWEIDFKSDEVTHVILPIARTARLLETPVDSWQDQIHSFHQGLIANTNMALALLGSDYQFATVPEVLL